MQYTHARQSVMAKYNHRKLNQVRIDFNSQFQTTFDQSQFVDILVSFDTKTTSSCYSDFFVRALGLQLYTLNLNAVANDWDIESGVIVLRSEMEVKAIYYHEQKPKVIIDDEQLHLLADYQFCLSAVH